MPIDVCYPDGTDWSCAYTPEQIADLDPTVKERAEALAWSSLSSLLGYRLSLCPVIIRPCAKRCNQETWDVAPVVGGGLLTPYVANGQWYNGCGCVTDCSCTSLSEVILPAEVGGIESVTLDGATLDPSAYRVDNGTRLVRTDGSSWPMCQDMSAPSAKTYDPVVVTLGAITTVTLTRVGNVVTATVEPPTNGGSSTAPAGTNPWAPKTNSYFPWPLPAGFLQVYGDGRIYVGSSKWPEGTEAQAYSYFAPPDTSAPDMTGTFEVSYYPGLAPNDLLRYAAGLLANEFYQACQGRECRLPSGVTNVTRAGITMEVQSGLFVGGSTGITEVDAIIRVYNPNALKGPSRVLSPDRSTGRTQTWSA